MAARASAASALACASASCWVTVASSCSPAAEVVAADAMVSRSVATVARSSCSSCLIATSDAARSSAITCSFAHSVLAASSALAEAAESALAALTSRVSACTFTLRPSASASKSPLFAAAAWEGTAKYHDVHWSCTRQLHPKSPQRPDHVPPAHPGHSCEVQPRHQLRSPTQICGR